MSVCIVGEKTACGEKNGVLVSLVVNFYLGTAKKLKWSGYFFK